MVPQAPSARVSEVPICKPPRPEIRLNAKLIRQLT
jgi:hypothetical protein